MIVWGDELGSPNKGATPRVERERDETEPLRARLDTRMTIGQAQGLLMAWLDMDQDQAFAHLQRVSSHQNRKLREVAAEIVRARQRPPAIVWGEDRNEVEDAAPLDPTDQDA